MPLARQLAAVPATLIVFDLLRIGLHHFHLGDEQFWRDRQGTADEDACLRRSRMSTSIAFARASPAVEFGTGR